MFTAIVYICKSIYASSMIKRAFWRRPLYPNSSKGLQSIQWQRQKRSGIFLFAVEEQHIQKNLTFPSTLCPVSMPLYYVIQYIKDFGRSCYRLVLELCVRKEKIRKQRLFCQKSHAICFWLPYVIFHYSTLPVSLVWSICLSFVCSNQIFSPTPVHFLASWCLVMLNARKSPVFPHNMYNEDWNRNKFYLLN